MAFLHAITWASALSLGETGAEDPNDRQARLGTLEEETFEGFAPKGQHPDLAGRDQRRHARRCPTDKRHLADIIAGLTVAIVALPLSMAIAIGSGVTPDRGLYAAVIGGFVVAP